MKKLPKKLAIKDNIEILQEYNLDLQNNHIYLLGEESYIGEIDEAEPGVEFAMANRFIKNVQTCMNVNPDKPLLIHSKTCGGDWQEGIAIYDTLKNYPKPVWILNYTHARSMSSLIFQAADYRVMMPNSVFMFHWGSVGAYGEQKTVMSELKFYDKHTSKIMVDIYIEKMKEKTQWTREECRRWLVKKMNKKGDVYLTAEQTVEYGFADTIFTTWEEFYNQFRRVK